MIACIRTMLDEHRSAIDRIEATLTDQIAQAATEMLQCLRSGGKILVMGNGGSAADAQHLVAELVGRFLLERRPLPALALTTNSSSLTAIANDYGYDDVFARQVEALADPQDLVLGISTSGHSPNVLKALQVARHKGCRTLALLGRDGGVIRAAVDLPLVVDVAQTPRIQEAHALIIHMLCGLIDAGIVEA